MPIAMTTTSVTAAEIMDRVAQLLNDPAKTDYTYVVQMPYLNMAIDELIESSENYNNSIHNITSAPITIPVGKNAIFPTPPDLIIPPGYIAYPNNLVDIQEVLERNPGGNDTFIALPKKEFIQAYPQTGSLSYWAWEHQVIKFNPIGANTPKEVILRYITHSTTLVIDPTTVIPIINCRSYLSFKTAALCAMFIGENQTRAQVLEAQADEAMERITNMSNRGRQQIMTRHRPFRAGWKTRGGY